MKIWLDQGCAYGNLGDEAMLLTAIDHLKKCFPGCQFVIPAHLNKPLPDVGPYQQLPPPHEMFRLIGAALRRRNWLKYLSRPWLGENWDAYLSSTFIDGLFKNLPDIQPIYRQLHDAIDACDMYYAVGAANLHDWSINESLLPRLWTVQQFKQRNKPVIISSQTIGPLTKRFAKYAVRKMVNKADQTTLRDPQVSLSWLNKIGLSSANIQAIGDEAFALKAAAADLTQKYLDQNGISKNQPYTLFHVRQTTYRGRLEAQNPQLLKTLRRLACDRPVLLCPMSYGEHSGLDTHFFEQIKSHLNLEQIKVAATITDPQLARSLVERSHSVVALSYHLQVFAIAASKPFICLTSGPYYEHKAKAILDWVDPEFRFLINLDDASLNPDLVCDKLSLVYPEFTKHLNAVRVDIRQRQEKFHSQLPTFTKK
ncbi:MAG: polysaccharide pyruvyl transferase family protein [Phycisphaeraceae bacterium]|nr:polysaccharide pyruvyl transferase family protein [Phycisphaeraceae bacterium]